MKRSVTNDKKYLLKSSYSYVDNEVITEHSSFEEAWNSAKQTAISIAENASYDEYEIGLSLNKAQGEIIIHYISEDTYSYYRIFEREENGNYVFNKE